MPCVLKRGPIDWYPFNDRDTMDSVKQSAALCLLRLYKTSPDLVLMGEWTSRVVHLLNDQHMVREGLSLSYTDVCHYAPPTLLINIHLTCVKWTKAVTAMLTII